MTSRQRTSTHFNHWLSLTALLIVSLFLLAACDGDEDDGTPGATDDTATATATSTEQAETPPAGTTPEVAGQYGLAPGGSPTPAATEAAAGGDPVQFALLAGIGQEADDDLLGEWDTDIKPDGEGLPNVEGNVAAGAGVYATSCARCHGTDGAGSDLAPALILIDGEPGLWEPGQERTVANYWPYLTSYIDYIRRSMPFDNPNTLSDEELYSVVAWILNQNGMLEADASLNPETIMGMNELPSLPSFLPCYPDDCRPEPELQNGGSAPEETPTGGGG